MAVFLVVILGLLLVRVSVQNFQAEGVSMMPGLHDGEHVVVNKLAYTRGDLGLIGWLPFFDSSDTPYLWGGPDRGDIIVFQLPQYSRKFIKRVIGVPGDTIAIRNGRVFRNGEVLDEPYAQGETQCLSSCGPWTVPGGQYFVLGDNRGDSLDSRAGWLVPSDRIVGEALFSY